MARQNVSAKEIKSFIQVIVDQDGHVMEDGFPVKIGLPHRCEPDTTGANWRLDSYKSPSKFEEVVTEAVNDVRQRYNLSE